MLDFAPPLVALELGVLVPSGSPVTAVEAIDRAGLRIGVSQGSSSERALGARLRQAVLQPQATPQAAAQALREGRIDAFATNKAILFELADQVDSVRVLDGRWGLEQLALGVPKGRGAALPWLGASAPRCGPKATCSARRNAPACAASRARRLHDAVSTNDHPGDRMTTLHRRTIMLAALAAPWVRAQGNKPLRIIVPFTPGGSTDILARALAPKLGAALGQTVVIDNKAGAGGSLGAAEAAKAEPDGNTLLMGHIGTLAVNPALYPRLAYDPVKSFAPVAWVARVPNVLVVPAASPVKSLKDFIELARSRPGRMTYSSGGNGSAAHITFEYLKQKTGIFVTHVPYRGTAPSVTDVIAGQIDATFTGTPAVLPHVKSGRLRALAVSGRERIAALPDVPTVAESGIDGFDADQWYGIVAPAGTPAARVAQLNAEINKALALPDVARQLAAEGAVPTPTTPAAFGALIARELPRWAQVVKAGNVKPE